jgi:hypothetical protein
MMTVLSIRCSLAHRVYIVHPVVGLICIACPAVLFDVACVTCDALFLCYVSDDAQCRSNGDSKLNEDESFVPLSAVI